MEKEIWKPIPRLAGYEASDLGRIRSVDRPKRHYSGSIAKTRGRILSKTRDEIGRECVTTSVNGKTKTYRVHRLVMAAFEGSSDLQVDHINGKVYDNRLKNLRYCTNRQNTTYSQERKKNKSSKYTGVHYARFGKTPRRWRATIYIDGRTISLGSHEHELQAKAAYDKKLAEITV